MSEIRDFSAGEFQPSGWSYASADPMSDQIVQMMEQRGDFKRVALDEIERLRAGEPVVNKVEMTQFSSLADFERRMDNFPIPFTYPEGNHFWVIKRRAPAFQRFEGLYPEVAADLTARAHVMPEQLFLAYGLMSELVSRDDPMVVQPGGQVDSHFLCR